VLIAGSLALAALVLLVDHALPAVTLAPLGAISVLGIAVAAGSRCSSRPARPAASEWRSKRPSSRSATC
jgi:hypothetical protein